MEDYSARNELLLELGFKDYPAYLRSKLWKRIRTEKLAKDPVCFACGRTAIQVHHGVYDEATLTGECAKELYSVCKGCHERAEITRSGYKRSPKGATNELKRMRRINLALKSVKRDSQYRLVAVNLRSR